MTSPAFSASGSVKVPAPAKRSSTRSEPSAPRDSSASETSDSAARVLIWKKLGAETVMVVPRSRSRHAPFPDRTSTPAIFRSLAGPLTSTRTRLVVRSACPSVVATGRRGNGPGAPHSATSASRVFTADPDAHPRQAEVLLAGDVAQRAAERFRGAAVLLGEQEALLDRHELLRARPVEARAGACRWRRRRPTPPCCGSRTGLARARSGATRSSAPAMRPIRASASTTMRRFAASWAG